MVTWLLKVASKMLAMIQNSKESSTSSSWILEMRENQKWGRWCPTSVKSGSLSWSSGLKTKPTVASLGRLKWRSQDWQFLNAWLQVLQEWVSTRLEPQTEHAGTKLSKHILAWWVSQRNTTMWKDHRWRQLTRLCSTTSQIRREPHTSTSRISRPMKESQRQTSTKERLPLPCRPWAPEESKDMTSRESKHWTGASCWYI